MPAGVVHLAVAFETADPLELKALLLEVMVDDGCVVYFNGQEVARSNMPEGAVEFATKASKALGGSSEHQWLSFDVKPTSLRKGKNVVAVEVHQRNRAGRLACRMDSHSSAVSGWIVTRRPACGRAYR